MFASSGPPSPPLTGRWSEPARLQSSAGWPVCLGTTAVAVLPERSVKLPARQQSLSFVIHLVTPPAPYADTHGCRASKALSREISEFAPVEGATLSIARGEKKERNGVKPDFFFRAAGAALKKGSVSLSASGAETDVQVSSAISVMKCKGTGSYELLNKTIFHSSNIPFFSPLQGYLFFAALAESRQAAERHGGYCYSFLCRPLA